MKTVGCILLTAIALCVLLSCQSSKTPSSTPPYTLEQSTIRPTLLSTSTSEPAAEATSTSLPTVEKGATPDSVPYSGTATATTAKGEAIVTASPQGCDDGKIVYISQAGGQTDLWLVDSGGAEPVRLTNDKWIERNPRWSPDGDVLAYVTKRNRTAANSDQLWILDVRDGQVFQLTDLPLSGLSSPTWSPDGQTIAYSDWTEHVPHIWLTNIETGDRIEIAKQELDPLWSPDGTKFAVLYHVTEEETGIVSPATFYTIIGSEGEPFESVPYWQRDVTGMSWSHKGDRLLVAGEADKAFLTSVAALEIIRVEDKTAAMTAIHMLKCNDEDCDFYSPTWFPSDKEILFIAAVPLPLRAPYDTPEPDEPEGKWWIYRATDDLSSIQAVFESDLPVSDASLSPDGTRVVFVRGEYADAELWILDLGTGEATQLTNNDVNDSSPIWQPVP